MTIQDIASSEFSRLLAGKIGVASHNLWFGEQTRLHWAPPTLHVGVPNRHFVEWLSERYGKVLAELTKELAGDEANVVIRIDQELFRKMRSRQGDPNPSSPTPSKPTESAPLPQAGLGKSLASNPVRNNPAKKTTKRLKSLNSFFPGQSNRQACTAAMAVSQKLISTGTVLFLGQHGVGKTHLLEGIALAARGHSSSGRVLILSAEEFLQKFLQNLRANSTSNWRRWIRSHELFLLDDLHRLAGKRSTQEELLHVLDHLQRQGGVFVACTTDWSQCRPSLIPELADRLTSGIQVRLTQPDPLSKAEIFKSTLESLNPILTAPEVAEWIGKNLQGNAREVQGAAHTLWLAAKTRGTPIDLELARETLGHLSQLATCPRQLEDIEATVVSVLGIEASQLRGKSRDKRLSLPRFLAAYLARKHTTASATEIGSFLGGRSHSTVLGCDKKVKAWLDKTTECTDRPAGLETLLERLEAHLQANPTSQKDGQAF